MRILLVVLLCLTAPKASQASPETDRRIAELVYRAKSLGATYEEVQAVCRGHWVCTQVAADAYDKPTGSPYINLQEDS